MVSDTVAVAAVRYRSALISVVSREKSEQSTVRNAHARGKWLKNEKVERGEEWAIITYSQFVFFLVLLIKLQYKWKNIQRVQ